MLHCWRYSSSKMSFKTTRSIVLAPTAEHHGLGVAPNVPGETDARLDRAVVGLAVVAVGRVAVEVEEVAQAPGGLAANRLAVRPAGVV